MPPHNWQFFIAESDSLNRVAEISHECREKSFNLSLNRPGTFSCSIPLQTDWYAYLEPWEHCLVAQKNQQVVWSGPLQTKTESFNSNKIGLTFVGWFELLNRRFIVDASHTYTTTNRGTVAFNLLALANALSLESETRATGITAGDNTAIGTITRTYERWQNIGASIIELTEIEDGFDFDIDPETKEMNIRHWDEFTDQTGVVWGYNWGPDNVADLERITDGDALINDYYVVGQYGTSHANDTDAGLDKYGVHQHIEQLTELNDTNFGGTIANIEIATNKIPRISINFNPRSGNDDTLVVPSIFDDFQIGDKTYITAKRGNAELIGQAVRIFGWDFNIDDLGNEKVSTVRVTYG
jgi:hypothetical protein